MKFGKRLKMQIEQTLPEWRDKFLSYKELKQQVKLMSSASATTGSEGEDNGNGSAKKRRRIEESASSLSVSERKSKDEGKKRTSAAESDFVELLNAEIDKFNAFFVEQEEEYIIRQKELQDRIDRLTNKSGSNGTLLSDREYNEEMIKLQKDIVNFHGEMVLLENYSALNYTGLVKILKKYDKRTGGLLRQPFIQRVLQQPFFTTEQLSMLVRDWENTLHNLFPDHPRPQYHSSVPEVAVSAIGEQKLQASYSEEGFSKMQEHEHGNADSVVVLEKVYTSIVAALRTMKEIRERSSTYSIFSLPPLQFHAGIIADENEKSIPSSSSPLISVCPKP